MGSSSSKAAGNAIKRTAGGASSPLSTPPSSASPTPTIRKYPSPLIQPLPPNSIKKPQAMASETRPVEDMPPTDPRLDDEKVLANFGSMGWGVKTVVQKTEFNKDNEMLTILKGRNQIEDTSTQSTEQQKQLPVHPVEDIQE
ncbi:hypothetical protein HDU76_010102, partial [Blyttiomyces sp. JEL0837]